MTDMKSVVVVALVVALIGFTVYQNDPTLFGLLPYGYADGFANDIASSHGVTTPGPGATPGQKVASDNSKGASVAKPTKQGFANQKPTKKSEGFADVGGYEGPANFSNTDQPDGCYPRDQLTPSELLPKDMNSVWAEQNPMGPGSLKGKNFLSAGALIGVNTVGQSLRNANLQVRSEPPNPQMAVSIFNQSTISPDISHRPLEIGA
jgi:hypothetical protein